MKHALLLSAWAIGLLAGQVSAGLSFTFSESAAMQLGSINSYTDGQKNKSSLFTWTPTTNASVYGASMQGAVGFTGRIGGLGDPIGTYGWMLIGAISPNVGNVVPGSSLLGYSEYDLFVANDDNSKWSFGLFVATPSYPLVSGVLPAQWTGWTELEPGHNTTLRLDLQGIEDIDQVQAIGFAIEGMFKGSLPPALRDNTYPSNPDIFHVSVVPVPAGVLLGFLGLTVAGLGLRKLV